MDREEKKRNVGECEGKKGVRQAVGEIESQRSVVGSLGGESTGLAGESRGVGDVVQ